MKTLNRVPKEIKQAIRYKYAWPGGYPLYLLTSDGCALCVDCGRKEYKHIVFASRHNLKGDCWKIEGAEVNWEDPILNCDHCDKRIESAYAEDEAEQEIE